MNTFEELLRDVAAKSKNQKVTFMPSNKNDGTVELFIAVGHADTYNSGTFIVKGNTVEPLVG